MNNLKLLALSVIAFLLFSATFYSIELETKSLLNDKIELKIPKGFEIMDEGMMKLKYPSERRPALVYTDKSGEINVALNLTQNKASQELMHHIRTIL